MDLLNLYQYELVNVDLSVPISVDENNFVYEKFIFKSKGWLMAIRTEQVYIQKWNFVQYYLICFIIKVKIKFIDSQSNWREMIQVKKKKKTFFGRNLIYNIIYKPETIFQKGRKIPLYIQPYFWFRNPKFILIIVTEGGKSIKKKIIHWWKRILTQKMKRKFYLIILMLS